MPTYTYQCKKCASSRDVFHGISARPRVRCETCGGVCRRLLGTGASVIFKGSGFYETDYKNGCGATRRPKTRGGGSSASPASNGTAKTSKEVTASTA